MAAAFVHHENLFNALKDARARAHLFAIHPPRASSGSRADSFFISIKVKPVRSQNPGRLRKNLPFAHTIKHMDKMKNFVKLE